MSFTTFDAPGYRLESKEAALQWVLAELRDLKMWRAQLDLGCADPQAKRGDLRREFWKFLVRHGKVVGALMALHRTGWLTAEQYTSILQDTNMTMVAISNKLCE